MTWRSSGLFPQNLLGLMNRLMLREQLSESETRELEAIIQEVRFPQEHRSEGRHAQRQALLPAARRCRRSSVGGEKIATLSIPGAILGEMSLIAKMPCSASSIAETDVVLLMIESGSISRAFGAAP